MRAARFRGSRIRSPSSRSKRIEKINDEKARQRRAFSLAECRDRSCSARQFSLRSNFYLVRFCRMQDVPRRNMTAAAAFEKAVALTRCAFGGYPVPLGKKSRVRLITYRQCADQHFEKTSGPVKRKRFMNFFLSSCVDYCGRFRVSIRRADSTPCHLISKAAACFCGREVDSVGTRNPSGPLHTN
jgi:hypothetical protein